MISAGAVLSLVDDRADMARLADRFGTTWPR